MGKNGESDLKYQIYCLLGVLGCSIVSMLLVVIMLWLMDAAGVFDYIRTVISYIKC